MYEVIQIEEYDVTRLVYLRNVDTGVIDICFDDSALSGDTNFDFIQVGHCYECKIDLMGEPYPLKVAQHVSCVLVDSTIQIGQRRRVKVMTMDGVYYVPLVDVEDKLTMDSFDYFVSRKNLVQVNDIVHADFL